MHVRVKGTLTASYNVRERFSKSSCSTKPGKDRTRQVAVGITSNLDPLKVGRQQRLRGKEKNSMFDLTALLEQCSRYW